MKPYNKNTFSPQENGPLKTAFFTGKVT